MKMLILDGNDHMSMDDLHTLFAQQLEFPAHYGRNLDALFDCLTELSQPVTICVDHVSGFTESPEGKGEILLKVLERAAEENDNLMCLFAD